jgi:hypothetical protein
MHVGMVRQFATVTYPTHGLLVLAEVDDAEGFGDALLHDIAAVTTQTWLPRCWGLSIGAHVTHDAVLPYVVSVTRSPAFEDAKILGVGDDAIDTWTLTVATPVLSRGQRRCRVRAPWSHWTRSARRAGHVSVYAPRLGRHGALQWNSGFQSKEILELFSLPRPPVVRTRLAEHSGPSARGLAGGEQVCTADARTGVLSTDHRGHNHKQPAQQRRSDAGHDPSLPSDRHALPDDKPVGARVL